MLKTVEKLKFLRRDGTATRRAANHDGAFEEARQRQERMQRRSLPGTGADVPSVQEVMRDDRFAYPERGGQLGCCFM